MTGAPGIRQIDANGKAASTASPSSARSLRSISPANPLHDLTRRHDQFRTQIRIWVKKYGARIAAPLRLVGKQALELELSRGAQWQGRRPGCAPMSVVTGPQASGSGGIGSSPRLTRSMIVAVSRRPTSIASSAQVSGRRSANTLDPRFWRSCAIHGS